MTFSTAFTVSCLLPSNEHLSHLSTTTHRSVEGDNKRNGLSLSSICQPLELLTPSPYVGHFNDSRPQGL